jgi:hypothetical protein
VAESQTPLQNRKAKIEQLENLNKLKSLRHSIQTDERAAKKPKKQETAAEAEQAPAQENAAQHHISFPQSEARSVRSSCWHLPEVRKR